MVLGPGRAAKVGAWVSATLMTCDAVAVLPQSSIAVHVRVQTTGHVPELESLKVSVTLVSHVSEAVVVAKTGVAGHWIVLGAGTAAITGGVVSCTETVATAVDELPHASVAV